MTVLIYGTLFQTSLGRANPFHVFKRKFAILTFFNRDKILNPVNRLLINYIPILTLYLIFYR